MADKSKKPIGAVKHESEASRANDPKDPATHSHQTQKKLPYDVHARKESVDVVGVLPQDVTVDPFVTEGQPGYTESGKSAIHLHKLPP
jgi:hypothetical protein